ncbi:hypothetical protein C10C_0916 [Chlamydia serpentis]|uniref:Uncharacterized protein n=1 Tax=Chlamydia serpentis TaxID=1967782 RepID=A0A2R8FCB1_9CHLA|nr:hypothetical protein [Chlamydia serpentis]SPN74053.1 hypothetical protein C10C_0916 [Chlamydia serpentis]
MRIVLSLLSLLMIFPLAGEEVTLSLEGNDSNKQEIVDSAEVQTCIYHSYEQGLQASRNEGKPLVIVLFSNPGSDTNTSCIELHQVCDEVMSVFSESIFSDLANFVVLIPSGINPLVYPPVQDPILGEIKKFKLTFQEETFPEGLVVAVVCVTPEGSGEILEVSLVPLAIDEEVVSCPSSLEDKQLTSDNHEISTKIKDPSEA